LFSQKLGGMKTEDERLRGVQQLQSTIHKFFGGVDQQRITESSRGSQREANKNSELIDNLEIGISYFVVDL
jgi:hypothetical protein